MAQQVNHECMLSMAQPFDYETAELSKETGHAQEHTGLVSNKPALLYEKTKPSLTMQELQPLRPNFDLFQDVKNLENGFGSLEETNIEHDENNMEIGNSTVAPEEDAFEGPNVERARKQDLGFCNSELLLVPGKA